MAHDDILGNARLTSFDFCIIGSGAGGGSAAHVLTAAGHSVLVLEAGDNPFPGLDDPKGLRPPLHSNDELKYAVRDFIDQDSFLEPRVFRQSMAVEGDLEDDVNLLPKAVGGAFQHADAKTPRFNKVDFQMKTKIEETIAANPGLVVPGFNDPSSPPADFADWPFTYDDLEPFYVEAEALQGVQGKQGDNIYESTRSKPYPMPPGVPMYLALLLSDGARKTEIPGVGPMNPHTYPAAITSRPYGDAPSERPPCVDCGLCSGFGCPNHAKGSPAVTTLRRALLTHKCQLRYNAHVTRLVNDGTHVTGVEYVDREGNRQTATASAYILAASAIESARLCLLSPTPAGLALGDAPGVQLVGRHLMFHFFTQLQGFAPQRVHGERGRAVTHGITDCRGVLPGGEELRVLRDEHNNPILPIGGICEFNGSQGLPVTEDAKIYATSILARIVNTRFGARLKNVLRDLPIGQHLLGLTMHAEDAPLLTNFVDLDGRYKDVFGQPVARITYGSHPFQTSTRTFYKPFLQQLVVNAGATTFFLTPCDTSLLGPPTTRHIMGTLRMGSDPNASVVDGQGKFWRVDNLYACDGSVFPTASGYNPTLTIIASALRIAHGLAGTPPSA
jgi:choline dehydrogenase-like flavoprotein